MKRVLMIAYHYPPLLGSSGLQRTVNFARDLPESGWEPIVLSAHPRVYPATDPSPPPAAGEGPLVKRAFALDASRHLSLFGKYPGFLAVPDRWTSWWLGAVPAGLRLIRKHRIDAIWSTYPIATAHMIGATLKRLSGLPWIADIRDPIAEDNYPPDPMQRKARWRVERKTVERAERVVFTTPGTVRKYAARYPQYDDDKWVCLPNGFDETSFARAEADGAGPGRSEAPFTLLHSGTVYPSERDPTRLFAALGELKREGRLTAADLQLVLRASQHDDLYGPMLAEHDIADMVRLEPMVPYTEALAEMLAADSLLILQASNCNQQIPAKVYELMRAGRPILALTDRAGETAKLLERFGGDAIWPLDDKDAIKTGLLQFVEALRGGTAHVAARDAVDTLSRRHQARLLAGQLDRLVGG